MSNNPGGAEPALEFRLAFVWNWQPQDSPYFSTGHVTMESILLLVVKWVLFSAVAPQSSAFNFAGWVSPHTRFACLLRIGIGQP